MSIPSDNESFILLKCYYCGNYFKLQPKDINDEGILNIYCPSCGLVSDEYLTDDVLDLVNAKIYNEIANTIEKSFEQINSQLKGRTVALKLNAEPKYKYENQLWTGIDALEITTFSCCKKIAKIKPLLKFTGCYCPFCGVKNFETE